MPAPRRTFSQAEINAAADVFARLGLRAFGLTLEQFLETPYRERTVERACARLRQWADHPPRLASLGHPDARLYIN